MCAFKVLIAESEVEIRMALRGALLSFENQAEFVEVDHALDAMPLLRGERFDCVFLGDHFSDGGGLQVLRSLCSDGKVFSLSPIVMVLNWWDGDFVNETMALGVQGWLLRENIVPDGVFVSVKQAIQVHELMEKYRQAQEQLLQIQRLESIGQLAGGIAHDFNNLLTIILGNARLLRRMSEENKLDPEKMVRVETIEATARRGTELVRRLMIFSRKQPLNCKVVSVNDVMRQLLTILSHILGETILIKIQMEDDVLPVEIDVCQFENVVVNMVVNARDAMPRGGTLTIETQNVYFGDEDFKKYPEVVPGPYVMIVISDSGVGMEQDVVARIFEPFFTTKQVGKGTGLGLNMAYGFVKESGGFIHVHSEVNRGTVFEIYLPQAQPQVHILNDEKNEGKIYAAS